MKKILSFLLVFTIINSLFVLPTVEASKPFKDHVLPCTIIAGDFDYGEKGETYSGFLSARREGTFDAYRDDGSDMNIYQDAHLGFNRGEFVVYTVRASVAGNYTFAIRHGNPAISNVSINIDDGAKIVNYTVPATASWQDVAIDELGEFTLSAGTHTITISNPGPGGGFNFYYFSLTLPVEESSTIAKKEGNYRANILPTIIQAEDFDLGDAGVVSNDGSNDLKKYRTSAKLDIGNLPKDSGAYLQLGKGESANYTVDAEYPGYYDISINAISSSKAKFYVDGSVYPYKFSAIGGGVDEQIFTIYLTRGKHVLTLNAEGVLPIDYISVLVSNRTGIKVDDLNTCEYPLPDNGQKQANPVWREYFVSPNGDDNASGTGDAPFASIQHAIDIVSSIDDQNVDGDIVINVASGVYNIVDTIKINENASGRNGYKVVIRGDEKNKPIVSGGLVVSGWQKENDYVWSAPLDAPTQGVRQLYVNEVEATVARSKYRYYATDNYAIITPTDGFKVDSRNCPTAFAHPEDMQCVWDLEWKTSASCISNIIYGTDGGETNTFVMKQPYWNRFGNTKINSKTPGWGARFFLQNAKELLDEPGEFYYDRHAKRIYYYPYSYEDMTSANCQINVVEGLIKAGGSSKNTHLENLSIENVKFMYGAWDEPTDAGFYARQATSIANPYAKNSTTYKEMLGQIDLKYAKNISLINCGFQCLGSTAITMCDDVCDSLVDGCIITDVSGGGIVVDDSTHDQNLDLTKHGHSNNVTISNNILTRIGTDYRSSVAILGYYTRGLKILHNDVRNVPYTGISVGWGWQSTLLSGLMGDNEIAYNYVFDTNLPTHDGAQIYTLGEQDNVTIHDNYLGKGRDSRGGIYLDEGSQNMDVYNNVIVEPQQYWFFARAGVSIKNIHAYHNFSDTAVMDTAPGFVEVSDHTVVADGNWPSDAVSIMNNAGLEAKWKHLHDEVPYFPSSRKEVRDIPIRNYETTDQTIVLAKDFMDIWGVGYFRSKGKDLEAARIPTTYREGLIRNEEIQSSIFITSENYDYTHWIINNVEEDDFWTYKYNCKQSGEYDFWMKFRNGFPLASPHAKVRLYIDGEVVLADVELKSTGDNNWNTPPITQIFGTIHLTEGEHTVRIRTVDNGWSFYSWGFCKDGVIGTYPLGNDATYDECQYITEDKVKRYFDIDESQLPYKSFVDVENHWSKEYVDVMNRVGIINGVSENEFAPEEALSLYQTCWLALRVLGVDYNDDNWKQKAIELKLLNSVDEADGVITRERLANSIMYAYQLKKGSYNTSVGGAIYKDMSQIDPAYDLAVRGAEMQNLMNGDADGYFRPKDSLTRAEAATVFYRLFFTLN